MKVKLNVFTSVDQPSKDDNSQCYIVDVVNKPSEPNRRAKGGEANAIVSNKQINYSHSNHNEEFTQKVKNQFEVNKVELTRESSQIDTSSS